ncbi:hypothetical protein FACS189451_07810 [Bacteroidia bacterium]|nr:hypothetical protein FACS189451_07810 [Bacteroidia bacterium]
MKNEINLNANDHIQGNVNAKIRMIEYGDFQCPYCKKAYWILKELDPEIKENLCLVFRNYPLVELHPEALHAAVAAETTALSGKFWEMHSMIFEHQHHLDDASLVSYAQQIGMDIAEFEKNFGNEATVEKVRSDVESGDQYGVEGTPTFFINGKRFEGNWMSDEFPQYLKKVIAARLA